MAACVDLVSCAGEVAAPADPSIDIGTHRLAIHVEGTGSSCSICRRSAPDLVEESILGLVRAARP